MFGAPGDFPAERWNALNPRGVSYQGDGLGAVISGRSGQRWTDDWNELGFMNEYATSSLENDFNEIAENLMTGTPGFWERLPRRDVLSGKVCLAMEFLACVDPSLGSDAFLRLRPLAIDSCR